MNVRVIGLNHNTAPVKEREKALKVLREIPGILLATCNRVELYQTQNSKLKTQNCGIYYYNNEEAVRHLFRVAAGLDSQILGETEILGQVKEAYLKSGAGKHSLLGRVFEKAIEVGRRVRAETGISRGNASVAGAAVGKVRRRVGNKAKVLLIGSGKVTESIIKTMLKMNSTFILIANRTFDKALEIADRIGGTAIRFDQLEEALPDADAVISSTAAPHLILRKEQIGSRNKPLIIIDLAVPRDVDPAVADVPGVTLLGIGDVREEISLNLMRRRLESVFAERIVEKEVREFCANYALEPAAAD